MKSDGIARTKDEIERALRHGLIPVTDNRSVLIELGFQPSINDPETWERVVDYGSVDSGGEVRRVMARQRARILDVSVRS